MDCSNDCLCSILYLYSPHDDFSDGGGRGTSVALQRELSSYFTEGPGCQVLPQESEAQCRGSRCSSALLILLCFNSDHGSTSSWDRKCSVYTQTLAFFLRVPIIMVFFVIWAHIHYELACTHQLILYRPWNIHQMATIPIRVQC